MFRREMDSWGMGPGGGDGRGILFSMNEGRKAGRVDGGLELGGKGLERGDEGRFLLFLFIFVFFSSISFYEMVVK